MKELQKVLIGEQYGYVLQENTYLEIIRVLELQKLLTHSDERTFGLLSNGE